MPLLNIVGVTGGNRTPQYCLCFMSGETDEDYIWSLQQIREYLTLHNIALPKVTITDRELALMKAIDSIFPEVDHLLCRWHVNMNVVKNCKKHFATAEAWEKFYKAWQTVLNSPTEELLEENLTKLRESAWEGNAAGALWYLEDAWLNLLKEKLVSSLLYTLHIAL
jgi:hypothetical protein